MEKLIVKGSTTRKEYGNIRRVFKFTLTWNDPEEILSFVRGQCSIDTGQAVFDYCNKAKLTTEEHGKAVARLNGKEIAAKDFKDNVKVLCAGPEAEVLAELKDAKKLADNESYPAALRKEAGKLVKQLNEKLAKIRAEEEKAEEAAEVEEAEEEEVEEASEEKTD